MVTTQNAVNNIYAGTNFSGTNISGTANSAGVSLSVGAQSAYIFSNSNGVSFGTNGSTVTATVATNYVATNFATTTSNGSVIAGTANTTGITLGVPAFLTTARASTDGIGLNTAVTNATATINSSGFSFNGSGYAGTGFSGTNAVGTVNSLGVSVSVAQTNNIINAVIAGTQTKTSGTLSFANSNGVSFGMAGSNTITATVATNYVATNFATTTTNGAVIVGTANTTGITLAVPPYLTTARASTDAIGLNTAQTNATWTVNSSGFSLNASGYAGTGFSGTNASGTMNSNGLQLSIAAAGGGNINISAGTTSNNLTNFVFSNSNGVSFGLNGSTITGSVAAGGGGGVAISAGTQSVSTGTMVFSNSNGVTFGMSGSNQITASVDSTRYIGLNTAQTNATWTVNSSGFSLNASGYAGTGFSGTNASGTMNSNGLQLSIAAAGGGDQTVSMFPKQPLPLASSSAYVGGLGIGGQSNNLTYSIYLSPFIIDSPVSYNTAGFLASVLTNPGTGTQTDAFMWGLYTLNGSTLSLVSTYHQEIRITQNSISARSMYWFCGTNSTSNSSSSSGNISANANGTRLMICHSGGASLATGNYWLGFCRTQSVTDVGNIAHGFTVYHVSQSQSSLGSVFGSNVSLNNWSAGIYSSSTTVSSPGINIMPSSIATSAVTATGGASQNRSNALFFGSIYV